MSVQVHAHIPRAMDYLWIAPSTKITDTFVLSARTHILPYAGRLYLEGGHKVSTHSSFISAMSTARRMMFEDPERWYYGVRVSEEAYHLHLELLAELEDEMNLIAAARMGGFIAEFGEGGYDHMLAGIGGIF